jgi:hypothetical protein
MTGEWRWHDLVQRYTSLALTREEDKLVALSGVAEEYARRRLEADDVYLAGIWKSDWIHGLLWYSTDKHRKRPKEWRAPTWSWASIEGAITTMHGPTLDGAMVELDSAWTTASSSLNKFGGVSAGGIGLRGRLLKVGLTSDGQLTYQNKVIPRSEWHSDRLPSQTKAFYSAMAFLLTPHLAEYMAKANEEAKLLDTELLRRQSNFCLPLNCTENCLRGITVEREEDSSGQRFKRTEWFSVTARKRGSRKDRSVKCPWPFVHSMGGNDELMLI